MNAFASSNSPLTREAMEPFWLPMTPNRQFKAKPRIFVGAEGIHYVTDDNRRRPPEMGRASPRCPSIVR